MGVIHAPAPGEHGEQGRSLCGLARAAGTLSHDPAGVTCKRCRKLLTPPATLRPISWDEAIRDLLALLSGPPVEPYPVLTPDVWRSMRCRAWVATRNGAQAMPRHWCRCEACVVDEANARPSADWQASQQARPHRKHAHPFGSVRAALEALLRYRQDGIGARSSQGSLQSRAQEAAQLGTQVQTTARHDRDPVELRRATAAVDIEKALRRAYAEEQARRELTVEQCIAIVLADVDSQRRTTDEEWAERTGITARAVREMRRHGIRQVQESLAADGYIPEPRRRVRR